MRTLQVISPRFTRSRSSLTNSTRAVYLARKAIPPRAPACHRDATESLPRKDSNETRAHHASGMENDKQNRIDDQSLLHLWLGLVGRGITTSFGIAADAIVEGRAVVGATIDYGTALATSATRIARKVSERLLDLGDEAARRGEIATAGILRIARTTSAEVAGQVPAE